MTRLNLVWALSLCLVAQAETTTQLEASLDLRPSWATSASRIHSENEAALGLRLAPHRSVGYVQEFQHDSIGDGYARLEYSKTFTLRLYRPREEKLSAIRPHFYFPVALNGWLALSLTEIPIVHFFGDGQEWENRSEWAAEIVLLKEKLSIRLPVIVQNIYQRGSSWEHLVWLNPEAIYAFTEKTGFGLAYYSVPSESGVLQVVFKQAM